MVADRMSSTGATFITGVEALYGERGVPTYLAHRDVDGWGSMMGACLIASRPAAILCKLLVCRFLAGSPSARSHRRQPS
jgi:multiple sugar transport system permease protein